MTNGEKLDLLFPDGIAPFSNNWLKAEYKVPTPKESLVVEDCINRADAIKAMQDKAKRLTNEDTINGLCGAVAILFDLPSVEPKAKTGYWIDTNDNGFMYHRFYKCSNCENDICDYPENIAKYHYCTNCGAKMEVEDGK